MLILDILNNIINLYRPYSGKTIDSNCNLLILIKVVVNYFLSFYISAIMYGKEFLLWEEIVHTCIEF